MASADDDANNYRIKDIVFLGSARRILLQSANGPCPLLALCNVLLLRNQISISQDARYISFNELVDMVSAFLFEANSRAVEGEGVADVRESLDSCLEILPRLNVGLDVNVKFGSTTDFEFTRELAVFDLLDIVLFHGWVVSKQDEKAMGAFGHLSYNQIVEKLIAMHELQQKQREAAEKGEGLELSEEESQALEQGMLIQDFLDRTASQLSYDGLLELHSSVRERQLAVFFRNSHFNTLLRYEGDLYLLCTDIAFSHSHVVWEKLDEVDGDTSYCDAQFRVNDANTDEAAALAAAHAAQETMLANGGGAGAMDPDQLLAMQLMQEDLQAQQQQEAAAAIMAAAAAQQGQQSQGAAQQSQQSQQSQAGAAAGAATGTGSSAAQQQGERSSTKKCGRACSIM